ncbi:MAG: hypothetical protein EBU46_00090 [Nitrosomonadaceae bacterium]|nr:hypothetical protein [Nitrosomonadaceae bacterium]
MVSEALAMHAVWLEKSYKPKYGTFEKFCKQRCKFSRAHGYRYVKAGKLIQQLGLTRDTIVTEHVFRRLTHANEDDHHKIVTKAKELAANEPITGKLVGQAIDALAAAGMLTE